LKTIEQKKWPLLTAFPNLAKHIQPIEICTLPTPVEALTQLSKNAWVKRDDLSHSIYGGNKTRKFEFIAADILKSNANHILTIGGTGTNHGVATAMICRDLGLRCTIVTFNQPDSVFVAKNQALMKEFGAEIFNAGTLVQAALRFYASPRRLNKNCYFLPGGGGTALGALAYVNAAMELSNQIQKGECPEPKKILVPAGSVSTLAGLTLGCAIAGMKTQVIGIQVMASHLGPIEICTTGVGNKLIKQALQFIQSGHPNYKIKLPAVTLLNNWYSPGYGISTIATENAIALAASNGLQLDQTYSGKTFDAFMQTLSASAKPTLYWATYSSVN
jgi:D-cysteine desulfhydrase